MRGKGKPSSTKPSSNSRIEVIRIPPKSRHNERKKLKQSKLSKPTNPRKLEAIKIPSTSVPALSRVLEWDGNTVDPYHVGEILARYPIVMDDAFMRACLLRVAVNTCLPMLTTTTSCLVIKLNAVTENEREKRQASKYFNTEEDAGHPEGTTKEIMAFFPGGTPHLTRYEVATDDNVGEISARPELFDDETCTAPLIPHFVPTRHQQLADEIIKILQSAFMRVVVEKMVGMVARDRMLSDTSIDFSVHCICQSVGNCYTFDSYSVMMGCPSPPDTDIKYCNYAVLPVHLSNTH
ncbi:hypothetical protein PHMEG_00027516 [Phytophthora megakarya]|uniref:Uncharacterized protein n=1 Tax=Phytophthora megakarya TaxID=4795 RepID=A0A225V869_9STRA|nr:hypothetical protein PHMEG_00027516 [Phytophthora megakarya]